MIRTHRLPRMLLAPAAVLAVALTLGLVLPLAAAPARAQTDCPTQETARVMPPDSTRSDLDIARVAVEGDVMVLGGQEARVDGLPAGAAWVFRFDGAEWQFEQKLTPDEPRSNLAYGREVAVSGDVVAIGSREDLYVYRFDGSVWNLDATFDPNSALFAEIDVDGDTIVAGAPFDDDLGESAGAVLVYRYDAATWSQEAKLGALDIGAGDNLGISVDLDGDTLVSGSRNGAGRIYVFRRSGSLWLERESFIAEEVVVGDRFSVPVAIDGDTIVAGATGANPSGNDSGAAFVFRFDGTEWQETQKLIAPDGFNQDYFGQDVDVEGDLLVVGSPFDDPIESESGAAFVFRFNGSSWTAQEKIVPTEGDVQEVFGYSLDIDAGRVFITNAASFVATSRGSAFHYDGLGDAPCAKGTVGAASCAIEDVLTVNGSTGGSERTVIVGVGDPIEIALAAPSGGPASGSYVLWAWNAASASFLDLYLGDDLLGCAVGSTPLSIGAGSLPIRCVAGSGVPDAACEGVPTRIGPVGFPWTISRPAGLGAPIELRLQVALQDTGAGNARLVSLSNAVTLRVE